jgi:hypothetical protein
MTMPADRPTWQIVPQGQRLTSQLTNAGNGFRDVWEVTYEVTSGPAMGTTGLVRIPVAQYSPSVVKAAIDAQVSSLHDVAGL